MNKQHKTLNEKMMLHIYARTSSQGQNLDQQAELLINAYPSAEVHKEQASATKMDRPVLEALLGKLNEGDCLIIYDLSRLNRDTSDFLKLLENFNKRDIGLIIHSMGGQAVDTRNAIGKMILTVLASIDQMQVELMKEKQAIGIKRAQAEGKYKGKRQTAKTIKACKEALLLHKNNGLTKIQAVKVSDISLATLYRYINAQPK